MSIFTKKTKTVADAPKGAAKAGAKASAANGKSLSGVVVSTKMKDTIVVSVTRFVKHPKYERFLKVTKKYKAHDAGNTKQEGDKVEILECAPISKDKRFIVAA